MYFSIHSLEPPAVLPFWRNGPRRKRSTRRGLPVLAATPGGVQPAPLSRDWFQFQPTDPGDRSVLAATPGGLPTCSAVPETGSNSSLPTPATGPLWRQRPAESQPAPSSRVRFQFQTPVTGPFWRQRRAGPQPAPLPRGRFIYPNHLRRLPVCTETLASIPSRWGNWKTQSADSVWEPTGGHQYSDTNGERG